MLHTGRHTHFDWAHPRNSNAGSKISRRVAIRVSAVILILASLILLAGSQTWGSAFRNQNANSSVPKQANRGLLDSSSSDAQSQMVPFYAQNLYLNEHAGNETGDSLASAESVQTMLRSLRQGQPVESRQAAIAALTQAAPSVVPALLDALSDSDAEVRQGAAEILGARRAPEAESKLFFATYDPDASVRAASARALGELGAMYALPRLEWLQVVDTNSDVQLAARLAEQQVYTRVAATVGVRPVDLRVVTVAPSNARVYAATTSDLYAPDGSGWGRVGTLPDIPTTLAATGNTGQLLYLGTASSGVLRSIDGGHTWQAINQGLPTANRFTVTALTVNPDNPNQVYLTLATQSGPTELPLMPFGLFQSADGGNSWSPLVRWKVDYVTTRLVIDLTPPARLLGLTEAGMWEYVTAHSF